MKFLYILVPLFVTTLAITFDCQFENITWNPIGSSYSCFALPLNINTNRSLTDVTGNHLAGYSNANVTVVFTYDCSSMDFIPQAMENFFPSMAGLIIDYCGISTIIGSELKRYENLQWISLINNNIEHIPGDFFSQNSNLRFAHFNQNNIKSFGENFVISLESLQLAQFWGNVCIDYGVTEASLITNLILNIRNNCDVVPEETTTSSTEEPTCDINETICNLKIQNEHLVLQNAEMREKLDYLSGKMDLVMELIIELSTRPCGL